MDLYLFGSFIAVMFNTVFFYLLMMKIYQVKKCGIIIFVLIAFCKVDVQAQDLKDFFGQKTLDDYVVKHYDNESGLKQTIVDGLLLDQNEFLWLHTPSGLVRWDYNKFKYFRDIDGYRGRMSNFQKSPYNENEYIVVYSDGDFGFVKDSEFHESSKTINHSILMNIESPRYSKKLMSDLNIDFDCLNIYFKSAHEQVFINKDSLYFFKDGALEHIIENDLLRYSFYISEASVFNYKNSFFCILNDYTIVEYKSRDSIVYHNALKELLDREQLKLNSNTNELRLINGINHKNPSIIYKDHLYDIDIVGDKLTFTKSSLDLNISAITSIVYTADKENIFISSQSNGLFHLRRKRITSSFEPNSNRIQIYKAHIETDDGRIMTGGGSMIEDGLLKDEACFIQKESMLKTKNGLIYNMGGAEIQMFDPKTNECNRIPMDPKHQLKNIMLDENEVVWIIRQLSPPSAIYQLGFLDENYSFTEIDITFNCYGIWSMGLTPRGEIQINTEKQIYFIDRVSCQKDSIANLKELEIRDVWYLNDTLGLMATYNKGLYLLQDKKMIELDIKSDKIKAASCIIEDKYGELWITTNEGLFKINKSKLLTFIQDQSGYLYYNYYDTSYGLSNNEFNGSCNPCGNKLSDGRISFPSQKGLNYIDLQSISENKNVVQKVVSNMFVDDMVVSRAEKIAIDPNFFEVKFELAIPHHLKNEIIHIYHKLDGYEDKWMNLDPNKTILYSRLAPGDYSFQYKIVRDDEGKDVDLNEIKFKVRKKWYQKNGAILLFVLLVLSLIYLLFYLRLKYLQHEKVKLQKAITQKTNELNSLIIKLNTNIEILEETKEELLTIGLTKNKLLSIISHEIVGGIKMIQNISKILLNNSGTFERGEMIEPIKAIFSTSSETNSILNQILIWTKNQNKDLTPIIKKFNLYDITDGIIKKIGSQANNKNIQFKILIDKADFMSSDKNIILLILHSLLENEIKYNKDCKVTISSTCTDEEILIVINNSNDEGGLNVNTANEIFNKEIKMNLDSNYLLKGLGFWIVKDLLRKIKGNILFYRELPHSHTIEIRIPNREKVY